MKNQTILNVDGYETYDEQKEVLLVLGEIKKDKYKITVIRKTGEITCSSVHQAEQLGLFLFSSGICPGYVVPEHSKKPVIFPKEQVFISVSGGLIGDVLATSNIALRIIDHDNLDQFETDWPGETIAEPDKVVSPEEMNNAVRKELAEYTWSWYQKIENKKLFEDIASGVVEAEYEFIRNPQESPWAIEVWNDEELIDIYIYNNKEDFDNDCFELKV